MRSVLSALLRRKEYQHVGGGWTPIVHEPFSGAWQRNIRLTREDMLAFHAVFACTTLIASDISKLGLSLHGKDNDGIWTPLPDAPQTKLIKRPNNYQTAGQFLEAWLISKLARGNTYIYKDRDALHVLHPDRVKPLVSESGIVFYQVAEDTLAGIYDDGQIVIPAENIIHDRFNCLYHPLVGLSPLYAASLAVTQGRQIQSNSTTFFGNHSTPGGILTVPGAIGDDTAKRLKETWEQNHAGLKSGKVAVLGDGMKYEPIAMNAQDSQLIEQLRWTAEVVCSVFHVPPYKIGVGDMPSYNNIQALNQEYFSQCLQRLIKDIQTLLNLGLSAGKDQGFRFDLDALLMMDGQTQMGVLEKGVGAGIMHPNHARRKFNLPPVEGGDSPYMQQQNYSLEALARRDSQPYAINDSTGANQAPEALDDDTENLQQTALSGAQVTALQGIIFAVENGEMSPETAFALISAAFPLVSAEDINAMLSEARNQAQQDEPEEDTDEGVDKFLDEVRRLCLTKN